MTIFFAMIFGALRALDGRDLIPRLVLYYGVTLYYYICSLDVLDTVVMGILYIIGQGQGLSLGVINGVDRDWHIKFRPFFKFSPWLGYNKFTTFAPTKLFGIDRIKDTPLHGAAGMAVRWIMFLPAICFAHGLFGLVIGAAVAVFAGIAYYVGGFWYRRNEKYRTLAMVCIEFSTYFMLGLSTLPTWSAHS